MPRHTPGERLTILERRKNVAARYLRGESQWAIARAFEVDQATVSRDLMCIRAEWLASCLRDFDEVRAEQLAKVDAVEASAWQGWLRSQENAETLRSDETRTSKVSRSQAGDVRFLATVMQCVERRCALLGLDVQPPPVDPRHTGAARVEEVEAGRRLAEEYRRARLQGDTRAPG
jgi:hypothetical protein